MTYDVWDPQPLVLGHMYTVKHVLPSQACVSSYEMGFHSDHCWLPNNTHTTIVPRGISCHAGHYFSLQGSKVGNFLVL